MTRAEMRRRKRKRKRIRATAVFSVMALVLVNAGLMTWGDEHTQEPQMKQLEVQKEIIAAPQPLQHEAVDETLTGDPIESAPLEAEDVLDEDDAEEEVQETEYLYEEIPLDYETQARLREWCEQYSVPYQLALGVIEAESSFTPDASNGICYGYMQINSINQEWLREEIGVTDLTDPLQNLHSGVFMLGNLYGKYGDWHLALTSYNFGETGAWEHVFSKGLTSTEYSRKVMTLAEYWAVVLDGD
ncbi:transglycosylase SLT domain-containing protein [Anaerotruncus colihominis]|uniref:transglycosylase SLT domain-containing protein n=1 Tax=Anaerotruncus colihominis TaxID=169435 RepID=UPI00242F56E3|nr:transglycosylase SLT domain-containing protein [Anaerotruncus colihominis]